MTEDNFVDYVSLNVRSGSGGRGSSHLRREKNRSNLEGYGKDERNNLETLIENFDNE